MIDLFGWRAAIGAPVLELLQNLEPLLRLHPGRARIVSGPLTTVVSLQSFAESGVLDRFQPAPLVPTCRAPRPFVLASLRTNDFAAGIAPGL